MDLQDGVGMTALMHAAKAGKLSSVVLLLGAGARPDLTNNKGKTALELATKEAHLAIASALKDAEQKQSLADIVDVRHIAAG